MSDDLIRDIERARCELRRREDEASAAGYTLATCKAAAKRAWKELDELLDELVSGRSRFPLFEPVLPADGKPARAKPAAG